MPGKPSSYQQTKRMMDAARTGAVVSFNDGTIIGTIVERSGDYLTFQNAATERCWDSQTVVFVAYMRSIGANIKPRS